MPVFVRASSRAKAYVRSSGVQAIKVAKKTTRSYARAERLATAARTSAVKGHYGRAVRQTKRIDVNKALFIAIFNSHA